MGREREKRRELKKPTSSTTMPRPVVPKVSMAYTSPSSILVWSLFLTKGMDLPPWMW
jgi:hypothetical protein